MMSTSAESSFTDGDSIQFTRLSVVRMYSGTGSILSVVLQDSRLVLGTAPALPDAPR